MTLQEHIESIPAWRRLIICLLQYRSWRLARAYNEVACDLMKTPQWHLGDELRTLGEYEWAAIYGYRMPEYQKPEDFERRAIHAEIERDSLRRSVSTLGRQIDLMKSTSANLKKLRQQKRLPETH